MSEDDHADREHAGAIHHFELYAADIDTAVEFWDWLLGELGYEPKNDWPGGRSWVNGPTYVVLVEAEEAGELDRNAPGLNHVALHAPSRELVDTLTREIQERDDPTLLYEDQHPYAGGYYALYCEDPEGLKVEVVAPET